MLVSGLHILRCANFGIRNSEFGIQNCEVVWKLKVSHLGHRTKDMWTAQRVCSTRKSLLVQCGSLTFAITMGSPINLYKSKYNANINEIIES